MIGPADPDANRSDANRSLPPRVLIIEDEPLLAENLRTELFDAGFEVVGVAGRVEKALKLIAEIPCDIAIVDANLAGLTAAPAAAALVARKLPFVVLSGFAPSQLPEEFASAVFVQKPYRFDQLLGEVHAMLARKS
jgi:DNA-binding response OmpR family regulator